MTKTLKFARAVIWFQMGAAVFLLIAALLTIAYKADSGFWLGFQNRLAAAAGARSLADFGPEHAGRMSAGPVFALPLLGLTVWGITVRRFWAALIVTIIMVLATLGRGELPVLSTIVAVILITNRSWFRKEAPEASP